jgi:hypothetical protein
MHSSPFLEHLADAGNATRQLKRLSNRRLSFPAPTMEEVHLDGIDEDLHLHDPILPHCGMARPY